MTTQDKITRLNKTINVLKKRIDDIAADVVCGTEHVGFSICRGMEADDNRQPIWKQQRETRGFDDTETWGLDDVISKFMIGRLTRFKELTIGHPHDLTMEQWLDIIQQIIDGFQAHLDSGKLDFNDKVGYKKHEMKFKKGMQLLTKYYNALWW